MSAYSQLRELVALSLREITDDIKQIDHPGHPAVAAASTPVSLPRPLNIDAAERLPNGNLIFAAEPGRNAWDIEPAWHVFSRQPGQQDSAVLTFSQAGTIESGLGDDRFIQQAYEVVLRRQPDPDGHRAYRDTLQKGHKTRYGLLRELVGSGEASDIGWQLTVIPSGWMSDEQTETATPPDTVYIERRQLETLIRAHAHLARPADGRPDSPLHLARAETAPEPMA